MKTSNDERLKFMPEDKKLTERYFNDAEKLKNEIRNASDISPETISGKCYYLSSGNGDDANTGLSPDSPWKTAERLNQADLQYGDGVFFERDSIWYSHQPTNYSGPYALMLRSGVTYSAYGHGSKPEFRNCIIGSGKENWIASENENIWIFNGHAGDYTHDIGQIVFDYGKAWGIKIIPSNRTDPYNPDGITVNSGMVSNGLEYFYAGKTHFTSPYCLYHNLEFYHDWNEGKLYLYFDGGNPGEVFGDIFICRKGHIIRSVENPADITVDNLMLRFGGAHGVGGGNFKNVTFQNCEVGWMGGSLMGNENNAARYGNGIENWGFCDGFFIHHCYLYQCYDSCVTTQHAVCNSDFPVSMTNVHFYQNVMEFSNMGVELWSYNYVDGISYNTINNARITDCYMLYMGYGFGHQRPCGDKNGNFYAGGGFYLQTYNDCLCENNINLYASHIANYARQLGFAGSSNGPAFRNNVYLLDKNRTAYVKGASEFCKGREMYFYMCTEENMNMFANLMFDMGSVVYYYDGGIFPEEEAGVYR